MFEEPFPFFPPHSMRVPFCRNKKQPEICFGKFGIGKWLLVNGLDDITSTEFNVLSLGPVPPTMTMEFFLTEIKKYY